MNNPDPFFPQSKLSLTICFFRNYIWAWNGTFSTASKCEIEGERYDKWHWSFSLEMNKWPRLLFTNQSDDRPFYHWCTLCPPTRRHVITFEKLTATPLLKNQPLNNNDWKMAFTYEIMASIKYCFVNVLVFLCFTFFRDLFIDNHFNFKWINFGNNFS